MPERFANYGWRLRIGVMLPSVNIVAEPQIHSMLPEGVAAHVTRLRLAGGEREQLRRMADGVEAGAQLLADAQVDLIVFHCTAVSMLDAGMAEELRARIERTTGRPAKTTGDAALAALRAVEARRIVLLCPNRQETHRREAAFMRHHDVEIVRDGCLDIEEPPRLAAIEPGEFYRFAMAHRHDDADAYFIGCTAVRSAEVIDALERDLGRPVVTSNQAMVWHALRSGGIRDHLPGYGALLSRH